MLWAVRESIAAVECRQLDLQQREQIRLIVALPATSIQVCRRQVEQQPLRREQQLLLVLEQPPRLPELQTAAQFRNSEAFTNKSPADAGLCWCVRLSCLFGLRSSSVAVFNGFTVFAICFFAQRARF